MSAMVYQNNDVIINIDDPKALGLDVFQFISIPYTLKDSIEVNVYTITDRTFICGTKYIIPAQENS